MYPDECNLQQLLELAFRVPEIGAVNFNILYYILKTIVIKQGLGNAKAVFNLDESLSNEITSADAKFIAKQENLQTSISDEHLDTADANKLKAEKEKELKSDEHVKGEKDSDRWNKIKVFKRLDCIEDEINGIHQMISEVDSKVSICEESTERQERKFSKEISKFQKTLKSVKEEDLASKLKKLSSDVEILMSKEEDCKMIPDTSVVELDSEVTIRLDDLTEKYDTIFNDINKIKKLLNIESKDEEPQKFVYGMFQDSDEDEKPSITKADVSKIDLELLNIITDLRKQKEKSVNIEKKLNFHLNLLKENSVAVEERLNLNLNELKENSMIIEKKLNFDLNKLKEKFMVVEKKLNSDLNGLKEKNLILERNLIKCEAELDVLKASRDEMILAFDTLKENYQYIEKEMSILIEFPGLINRLEQLEGYVFSADDLDEYEEHISLSRELVVSSDSSSIHKAKEVKSVAIDDSNAAPIIPHRRKKTENLETISDRDKKRIINVSHTIADLYQANYLKEIWKSKIHDETKSQKTRPYTFVPDFLDEHFYQIKTQIIVYIKKRFQDFEISLYQIESNLSGIRKTNYLIDSSIKELAAKIAYVETNFTQRSADFLMLKEMVENHKVSILNIMQQLDTKANSVVVNQKINREELNIIEDRVLKLCMTTNSEVTKLGKKIDDIVRKLNMELSKKLYLEEFEVQFELLLHKLKVLSNKFKDILVQKPPVEFEAIRPVELQKYLISKGGEKIKQKKITSCTSNIIIPMLTQHFPERGVSSKTTFQVQNELDLTQYRNSKIIQKKC